MRTYRSALRIGCDILDINESHAIKEMTMPALLVRDLDESTKRALAISAAKHGRSQQAEAKAILEDALAPRDESWVQMLRAGAEEVGGIDVPLEHRHIPRVTGALI